MSTSQPSWFAESLAALVDHQDLTTAQMQISLDDIIAGACGEAETAAFLIALRMKGETAGEIAAAAGVLRKHMVPLSTPLSNLLDTSGTGGDGSGTFNISTATAFVAAGAGVPVVKHGNRAVSSQSGSADVLAQLGLSIEAGVEWSARCLADAGMAFCFAPHFHPVMAKVAPMRRRLRVRTIFNLLGPLVNPARAEYQLIGVGRPELLDPMAGAAAQLGVRHAVLVCSRDGMDEVSLSAPTTYREVKEGQVTGGEWTSKDFGLTPCTLAELQVANAAESAALVRALLEGQECPARRIVVANAAAALLAADRVTDLRQGVDLAQQSLASGRARQVLERMIHCSRNSG